MAAGVLSGFTQGIFKMEKTCLREAAAEDIDQVLASERLRHEFPALARFGFAGESGFDQWWRVELGFHGFSQVFDCLLKPTKAGFFFFDAADEAVEVIAGGFGEGVEESFQAVAAKGAGEERMERHRERPYH